MTGDNGATQPISSGVAVELTKCSAIAERPHDA